MNKIVVLTILAMAVIACDKKPEPSAQVVDPGEAIFMGKGACFSCHGQLGKGDGAAGLALKPRPRNYSDAKWKYGFDQATVEKTISTGSAGTAMISYKGILTPQEITAVASWVRKLGGKP